MQWIKASEQLPEDTGVYVSRLPATGSITGLQFYAGGTFDTSYPLENIEWLDESQSESTPSGWIAVTQELPELNEYVLIYNTEGGTFTGRLMANGWFANFSDSGEFYMGDLTATHWMPLPAPPSYRH